MYAPSSKPGRQSYIARAFRVDLDFVAHVEVAVLSVKPGVPRL